LGDEKDKDAQVWKVEIDGKRYALKMVSASWTPEEPVWRYRTDSRRKFEFRGSEYLRFRATRYLTRPLAESRFYYDYFDPFNCECRVYGRLKAEDCEELAVKAHGYLLLSSEQEAEVTKRMAGHRYKPDDPAVELDGDNLWCRWEEHRGQQVRAIVNDLITDSEGGDYPKPSTSNKYRSSGTI
jgi:hypothetical protein